ncbi:MAG: lysophospholipid acyltransferase family protein [Eubacteriales bacterium]|nr:lysophospholipid acyltransferase family protein [Eubacteriales bacterium]
MLRGLLVLLVLILFLVVGSPLLLFEYLLSKRNPTLSDRQSQKIVCFMFRLIIWISGIRLTVEGREHIPADSAVLFVGNHRSYFDIVTSYTVMRKKTGYIAKKEMEGIPLLKQWMDRIGCLFLDRKDIRAGLKTILQAISDIKAGTSLVIFPEGTRNRNESVTDLLEFKEGSLKIAEKSGCPVIPMAILGSADVFEKHMPFIRPADVVIRFGAPVDVKALPEEYKKKPALFLQKEIGAMLTEMEKRHPEAERQGTAR